MLDILFFHPPVTFSKKTDLVLDHPLLGTLYLGAILKKQNYSVEVFENRDRKYNLAQSIDIIRQKNPRIVGISSFTSNIRGAYQLAEKIKQEFGDKISVGLGGPHVSADPTVINRFPVFDWCITSEAENTLPQIVDCIIHQNEKVKGIFRGEYPPNLDDYPDPDRTLVDWSRYQVHTNNIMGSRGCPFRCVFCSIPAIERRTRYRSSQRIVTEMKQAMKYTKSKMFTFLDDTLTLNQKWFADICDEIINQDLDIDFEGHTRANLVNEDLIIKMKKAGLVKLIFGVESGNERIRNEVIGKGIKDEDVFKAVALCKKYKIKPDIYLMAGFPGETKKELEETVNFPKKVKPNIFGLHITIPLPGADLWEQAIADSIIPADTIDRYIKGELGEGFNEVWPFYIPKEMTLQDLEEAQRRAYRQYYFTPGYVWYRLWNDIDSWQNLKMHIKAGLQLLKSGHADYLE